MSVTVSTVENSSVLPCSDPVTAIFCVDATAFPVADVVSKVGGFELVRSIYVNTDGIYSSRIKISDVWINNSSRIALIRNATAVQGTLCGEWFAATTKDITISFSLILDGIYVRHPLAEAQDPTIRYMSTSSFPKSGALGDAMAEIDRLEVGQLVTSCSAFVLTRYEFNGTPAVLILVHRDLSYTVESAKCFEHASPVFSVLFGDSFECKPQLADYSRYVASDPYLISTGNIYG